MITGLGSITSAMENFSGTLRLGTVFSEIDTSRFHSFDQQYTLNYFRPMFPGSKLRISCIFSGIQTAQSGVEQTWHGELQPSGDINWTNTFFGVGVNYRYRETRDTFEMNNLLSRSAGGVFKTRFVNFPQSTLRYDWSRTFSSIISQPQTTEEKRLQYSANYSGWNARFLYSYTDREYDNLTADLQQDQQQHLFRLDYAHAFFANRLRFSGGYLFNFTRRREETGIPAEPLTQITTILGLYAEDSTPEFGALDTLSGLIDLNVTDATSPSIDIGGVLVNRNIGFDLGISRQISQIYIYTDRLSDPDEGWAIYTSSDNLEWTRLASGVSATFNSPLKRYKISFPFTEARYFKAVNSGVNEEPQVLVTEIQAFLSSQAAQQGPQDMQNHRVTVNASYQLYHSVSVGCDVLYGSIPDNSLGNGRQDGSFSGNVTYRPSLKFSATTRYSRDFVNYLDNSEGGAPAQGGAPALGSRGTETFSATFSSKPMETMDASLAASRTTNFDNDQESQRVKASMLRITTVWLPAFSTTSEFGFTRDQRVPGKSDYRQLAFWDFLHYAVAAESECYRKLSTARIPTPGTPVQLCLWHRPH